MQINKENVRRNYLEWMELMDLSYEMAFSALKSRYPHKDALEEYKKNWSIWQEEHLNASTRYMEVLSRVT